MCGYYKIEIYLFINFCVKKFSNSFCLYCMILWLLMIKIVKSLKCILGYIEDEFDEKFDFVGMLMSCEFEDGVKKLVLSERERFLFLL